MDMQAVSKFIRKIVNNKGNMYNGLIDGGDIYVYGCISYS